MYLYQKMTGSDAVEFCEERLDRFPKDFDSSAVERIEIYSSSIADDGDDFCEIRVFSADDGVLAWTRWNNF